MDMPSRNDDPADCPEPRSTSVSRRTLLGAAGAAGLASLPRPAYAAPVRTARPGRTAGPVLKPLPERFFVDHGTNAEMRWDSVRHPQYLTPQSRLFVRNHTRTPRLDASTYRLSVFGDGLRKARTADDAHVLDLRALRRLPVVRTTTVIECTGNGRSFYASQQGRPAPGTPWRLGSVGTVTWEGVRLRDLFRLLGLAPDAVDVMATGLDPVYVDKGTDHGHVRRPVPIAKALDDTILAWGMNGRDLLPDHGFPLRLVVPGWVGIASIKWLGSLEVSRTAQTSPWNTKWYRMTGGDWPADSPPLETNPVRSAWELAEGAQLPARGGTRLTGRAWSGAGPIASVEVSADGGATWSEAALEDVGSAWSRFSWRWPGATPGSHTLMARATDVLGRTQPTVARWNEGGYFFDAVVHHPVTVR